MDTTAEVLIILGLVLLNGFFAGAEIAVLTARRNRLDQAARGGSRTAQAALTLLKDTSQFLSTVQVGITGVGTFAAAYGGVSLVERLSERLANSSITLVARNAGGVSLALVTCLIAFASLVLGELVPKRIALVYAERLAQFVALPMRLLSIVTRPAVALLSFVTTAVLILLRVNDAKESPVTVDDIQHLLRTGMAQGVLEPTEQEVALEALRLRTRRVRDVMRPRIDIDAVDVDTPADEIVGVVAMSGFSRLPVYDGDLDHIVGFVYNKDLFQQSFLRRNINLRKMLRQPLFIPESLTLDRLLLLFQERRTQLAIVLDEFGGTRGMVTFEDVLEELVGEIHDEHRRDEEQRIVPRGELSWFVDGQLPLHELLDHLPPDTTLGPDAGATSTVAGLILASLAEFPKAGDVVACGHVLFEIVDLDGTRINRLSATYVKPSVSDDVTR
ncbi:MAG: HlyC/CorC family transporter [Pirellulales bacterium]|nr:HlyC/CorC family transporter [Pirellulales bacterium]